MGFRIANIDDLEQLMILYKLIMKEMCKNNIDIWNEDYLEKLFIEDIKNNELYVLLDDNLIISSFSLSSDNFRAKFVEWENNDAKAVYINRLGVHPKYLGKGIGSEMIKKSMDVCKKNNVEYLRLFVVDFNVPAIKLYQKNGFKGSKGIYIDHLSENTIFTEYGYEIKL